MPGDTFLLLVVAGAALLFLPTAQCGIYGSCYADSCYIIAKTGKTWDENQQRCKSKGGDLVSIETPEEWEYINSEIQLVTLRQPNEWHIGLKKDGDWKWVNGKPLTIKKWQKRQPSGDGNVAVMSKDWPPGSQGLFNDLDPDTRKPYICEIPVEKTTGQPAPPVLPAGQQGVNRCDDILDFEDTNQQKCFVVATSSRGTVSLSNSKPTAKNGAKSLKLESHASDPSKFRYTRPSGSHVQGKDLLRGGIKMWIYKTTAVTGKKMEVRLIDNIKRKRVGKFKVDMGFKGWRGIWVSYKECKERTNSLNKGTITTVDFVFKHQDTIYIDLLEFVPDLAFQSRDKIVPPFTKFGSKYNKMDFSQQSYRWSQETPSATPASIDASKKLSIAHIQSRLRNWYCDETTTTYDFTGTLKTRWNKLKRSIDKAQKEYDRLEFNPSRTVIIGPPLFCLICKKGSTKYSSNDRPRKFSFIMTRVLQPLAIELHLKSRPDEMTRTVNQETRALGKKGIRKALIRICGKHKARQDEFLNHLKTQGKPYTKAKVRLSLEFINQARLQRNFNVLDYLEDQGWADGSALGSLYLETLRSSAGFIHSLFLLKDTLQKNPAYKNRLINFINTAKWYHDFGEVYQSPFEYKGTTADNMITRMLPRLIIVMAMPTDTSDEQKARQRDMEALKKWMENALDINKAFGGVIKPDYTGFHHMTFYASAYIPAALHSAAQVQYFLEGTDFKLSDKAKRNLLEGLNTVKITAVKYSTPSSVGGRFPDYSRAILASDFPAYAYISVSYPGSLPPTPAKGIQIAHLNSNAGMFERLYQPSNADVANTLARGSISAGKSYFNTLGSLQLMNKVNSLATSTSVSAELSPEGHWTKNFAALSIHRRKDWVVTVKGFNKFVWDFEGTSSENPNGIFASHGSMLIANSEEALKAHDVNAGWDWTRIPGTTTMSLTANERKLKTDRNFSPQSSAGGVTFQGPSVMSTLSNGMFAMDFHQPNYNFLNKHTFQNIKLYFKKSVFFFQNLLVCLGSNIRVNNGPGKQVQTTLFQDKVVRGPSTVFIKVDGVRKDSTASAMTPSSQTGATPYTILVDTKGNSYYIPSSSAPSLKVHVQNQISENQSGKSSSGKYATAWLEHSSADGSYEYAVYVKTPSYPRTAEAAWLLQKNKKQLYEVLKQDDKAHVVKFHSALDRLTAITPLYGYAIFQPTTTLPRGPIKAVNKQCRIMVVESEKELYISISYPDLDFNTATVLRTLKDVGTKEMFDMVSNEKEVQVTLAFHVVKTFPKPVVHGSPTDYVPNVRVDSTSSPPPPNKGNKIVFTNLKNGFSVEIKLKK